MVLASLVYRNADAGRQTLAGTGSQLFSQDSPGVPGMAEGGNQFGSALAAGDFDNDGFADLAVGVVREDVGAAIGAGAVNILYGSAAGLTGTGSQQFWQGAAGLSGSGSQLLSEGLNGLAGNPENNDEFGWSLAAGDFNNNGVVDVAVGLRGEDFDAGAVIALYGSAGGLSGSGGRVFRQGQDGVGGTSELGDWFAHALVAGDFNNDGVADLDIGAPLEDIGAISDAGAINVLYSSAGGLTAAGNQQFRQGAAGVAGIAETFDSFGFALT
jgi:hypothetical protein